MVDDVGADTGVVVWVLCGAAAMFTIELLVVRIPALLSSAVTLAALMATGGFASTSLIFR